LISVTKHTYQACDNEPMKRLLKLSTMLPAIVLLSACASSGDDASSMVGKCPQPRFTEQAPEDVYNSSNPLKPSENVLSAGEELYLESSAKTPCKTCHGKNGDGRGAMASMFAPPPRNFSCRDTIAGVPDGQLFWIIKNGSPGTSMPAFKKLTDEQIWQLVHHIRELSKEAS